MDWLFDYEYVLLRIPKPMLTFYLYVDPEVSQWLMSKRYKGDEQKKDIHEKDFNYLKGLQDATDYYVNKLGWKVIECCRDGIIRSVDEIHAELVETIMSYLKSI